MPPHNTLNTIAATANTLRGWFAAPHNPGADTLDIYPYRNHHPRNTPTTASTGHPLEFVTVTWDNTNGVFKFNGKHRKETITRPPDTKTLRTTTKNYLTELTNLADTHTFNFITAKSSLPRHSKTKLKDTYTTAYHALTETPARLARLDGIGNKRAEDIQTTQNAAANYDWASLTHCPECDEQFWSGIFNNTQLYDSEPTIATIQERTYCPNCQHNHIPASHIMDPEPFTETTISNPADESTDTTTTSLTDY